MALYVYKEAIIDLILALEYKSEFICGIAKNITYPEVV